MVSDVEDSSIFNYLSVFTVFFSSSTNASTEKASGILIRNCAISYISISCRKQPLETHEEVQKYQYSCNSLYKII